MRSLARESVFKYLFSKLFNQDDEGLFDVLIKELNHLDQEFARKLLSVSLENQDNHLNTIEKLSNGFKLERVFNTDKIILILAMSELDNFPETDTAIIVDEAVKIAAKYSTEKSTYFINGILAEYAKDRHE